MGLVGIEPTTNWLWANCSNPWATGPYFRKDNGGRDGIRTHGTCNRFTPLAGEPFQPLRHPSRFPSYFLIQMAERQGFEPWEHKSTQRFSRPSPSTTQPSLQFIYTHCYFNNGSPDWIRTSDQMINSHLLYRWATEEHIH